MKANFVQKRREDHYPGPYEPPSAKVPRKSVIVMQMPVDLNTLMTSLVHPWKQTLGHSLCVGDSNNLQDYIHIIKETFLNFFFI